MTGIWKRFVTQLKYLVEPANVIRVPTLSAFTFNEWDDLLIRGAFQVVVKFFEEDPYPPLESHGFGERDSDRVFLSAYKWWTECPFASHRIDETLLNKSGPQIIEVALEYFGIDDSNLVLDVYVGLKNPTTQLINRELFVHNLMCAVRQHERDLVANVVRHSQEMWT